MEGGQGGFLEEAKAHRARKDKAEVARGQERAGECWATSGSPWLDCAHGAKGLCLVKQSLGGDPAQQWGRAGGRAGQWQCSELAGRQVESLLTWAGFQEEATTQVLIWGEESEGGVGKWALQMGGV
jgi:hypothetical protein